MDFLPDSFSLNTDAQAHVTRLRSMLPEFAHTRQAHIVCVDSQIQPWFHGHPCRAFIVEPKVQGPLRPLLEFLVAQLCGPVLEGLSPDYLIVFDAALWAGYSKQQREMLAYHELSHLHAKEDPETGAPKFQDDGRPALTIAPHDTEIFHKEIRRYGPAALGLDSLLEAIVEGQRRPASRARRTA